MSKKDEYAGVDEKYIPNNEVEEKNESGKSKDGIKTAKKIAIGYVIFIVVLFGAIIASFVGMGIFMFSTFNKTADGMLNDFNEKSGTMVDNFNNKESNINLKEKEEERLQKEKEMEALAFNVDIKSMQGTQSEFRLSNYLDEVVTKNKTNSKHTITVTYKETTTSLEDGIVKIKHSLDENAKYEVSLDYDSDGFINKVTIKDIVK